MMVKLLLGVGLAIAITGVLDGNGLTAFSALPLAALLLMFCLLDRLRPREIGFRLARPADYLLALGHPIFVMASLALIAALAGAIDLAKFDAIKAIANILILTGATFVVAIVTEEGFFRGWLWAGARLRGLSPLATLALTSAAFVAWHIPFVILSGEFHFGASDVPVFFVNATLIGLIWGLLRLGSGSVLVSSAGHGLWNGLTYVLFGVGSGVGALGIEDVGIYSPEVGLIAILLNGIFAGFLFWRFRADLAAEEKHAPTAA